MHVAQSHMRRWLDAAPGPGWWLMLAAALSLLLTIGWLAAVLVLAFALVQMARPLHFTTAYVLLIGAASFINYSRGALTLELSLLSLLILFALLCYALERRGDALSVPKAELTRPLLLYLGLSLVNFARGALTGQSLRYAGLEILAVLAISSAFMLGARRETREELPFITWFLWIIALGHVALGLYAFSILKVRTGSIYFTPVTGVVAMLLFNMALRAPTRARTLLFLCAMGPPLMHQFLSFTRGYWLGLIGATLFSTAIFVGRGEGRAPRLGRAVVSLGGLVVVGVLGALVIAAVFGIGNLGELAAARFASSTSTEYSFEASSNIVRLVEYMQVWGHIMAAPLFGHGLGYYVVVQEPLHFQLLEQWFVHQNYLLVWLKQGIIGLVLFIWVLVAAVRTGVRGARDPQPVTAGWAGGTAAATVYVAIHGMVHFPLAEVNTSFPIALLWGGTLSIVGNEHWTLRWRSRDGTA